jgi:hypothetical protein
VQHRVAFQFEKKLVLERRRRRSTISATLEME